MADDEERRLPVERHDDELVIDTSDKALESINDAIEGATNHVELDYLSALRDVMRYAGSPSLNVETGTDEHPPVPDGIDASGSGIVEELDEFRREKEAFRAAMEIETEGMLQADDEE